MELGDGLNAEDEVGDMEGPDPGDVADVLLLESKKLGPEDVVEVLLLESKELDPEVVVEVLLLESKELDAESVVKVLLLESKELDVEGVVEVLLLENKELVVTESGTDEKVLLETPPVQITAGEGANAPITPPLELLVPTWLFI